MWLGLDISLSSVVKVVVKVRVIHKVSSVVRVRHKVSSVVRVRYNISSGGKVRVWFKIGFYDFVPVPASDYRAASST